MNKPATIIQIILLLLSCHCISSQSDDWTHATSKDGKIVTKYQITEQETADQSKRKIISYKTETTAEINFNKVESFMRHSDNYRLFLDNTKESRLLKQLNEDEWLIYLYIDAPWPVPDSDCVQQLTFKQISSTEIEIKGATDPEAADYAELERIKFWDIKFRFVKQEQSTVLLTIEASFSPAHNIPKMFLKKWLPSGPEKIISNLVSSLQEIE